MMSTYSFPSYSCLRKMVISTFHVKPGSHFMNPLHFTLKRIPKPRPFSFFSQSRFTSHLSLSTSASTTRTRQPLEEEAAYFPVLDASNSGKKEGIPNNASNGRGRARVCKSNHTSLNQSWMDSLTCPFSHDAGNSNISGNGSGWVIGVDPDSSGALALLKPDDTGVPAQVFDSPVVPVIVGKRTRKRLDTKAIVQLLKSFRAPVGTLAFVEQSTPFPADGKQGWWTGGFNYGLWIGVLVASGFSVVPVPSSLWKNVLNLSGNGYTKDDSRRVASSLFPSLSLQLKRKKDHGRAEALLIAAYGRGLKTKPGSSPLFEEPVS